MTPEQIEELFISGAETERRLPPMGERPARFKAQAVPYFHSWIDVNGWGAERYQQEREDFYEKKSTRLKTADISRWELCNELVTYVTKERDRRCLWAWALSKATRKSFSKWCRDVEHVHRNYGTERKDAAVSQIASIFLRNTLEDMRNAKNSTLQQPGQIGDKQSIIELPRWSWMAPGAFSSTEIPEAQNFDWAEKRNEMRRQREAQARKQKAA
jgi:hypothetical protein